MDEKHLILCLIDTLWKWRKHLLIVLITTSVAMSAIMLSKQDYYRASTIFYPASTSIQKPVFTEADRNINYYGDDHDVDRMLSIATSTDTKGKVIKDLDLRSHYGLSDSEKDSEKLYRIFEKMYQVQKTEYDAIRIAFEDKDPTFSAKVANHARVKVDQTTQYIIKSAQKNVLKNAENSLKIIQKEMNVLKERLREERKRYGVYDTESQAEAFAILESRGGKVKQKVKDYTEGISLVKSLEDQIEFATENLVKYQSNTYRLKSAMESEISSMHVVQTASVPISKAGPFRSIYVLGALFLMALLSSVVILFMESIKR